ncbi:MAG: leucyl/phenylalanyl-tRNA--protein transferase [Gallionella sp.]|nr:leucyl/phenylalanyl-tRNA--protein transferase [Gallionella sp.]
MIPWLTNNAPFPPVGRALRSPNGLLAAGGDLSAAHLLEAYRHGIFPWFNPGEPILWWSPDPRMVLIPGEFKTSRSLARILRNRAYEVRSNTAFEQVMRGCAAPRNGHHVGCDTLLAKPADCGSSRPAALPAPEGSASPCQGGTWIHEDMIAAYCELHRMGYAHSVETWIDGKLAGGLYGVCIGRMFYGESMFSNASNASKIALAHLARQLERWQFGLIDCQMNTPHLASLGAREIPRNEFIARLQELVNCAPITHWQFDTDLFA